VINLKNAARDERPHMSLEDFKDFYWLKEELLEFCRKSGLPCNGRKSGLPCNGRKLEIFARIECFIRTGSVDDCSSTIAYTKTPDSKQ